MTIDLSGKRAFVSGSTLGIGFAIARGLMDAGASVTLNGRSERSVSEAVAKLAKENRGKGSIHGIVADLGTAQGAETIFQKLPTVDILINNVGIFEPQPFAEITDESWEKFFQVNVMSGVRLSRYYAPKMAVQKWGRIVFISSESGIQIPPEMIHYGMTKTAMLAISRGLAESLAQTGVTVNAVLPGPTRSEGVSTFVEKLARDQNKSFAEVEKEFFRTMRPTSLIQRFATPEEVANLVTYVVSPQASATTGAALRVDGGVARSVV